MFGFRGGEQKQCRSGYGEKERTCSDLGQEMFERMLRFEKPSPHSLGFRDFFFFIESGEEVFFSQMQMDENQLQYLSLVEKYCIL